MKNLMLYFLLLLAFAGNAQNFEGTIKWTMKMDVSDPATKAKFEEAQRKMNDPANQKKMKELEAKMNDPQMKAMMDANPQMKAQMENAIKLMSGGIDMNNMSFTIMIKGENSLTKMDAGFMTGETLYLKDKNASYTIDRTGKTYSPLPTHQATAGQPGTASTAKPKVTKTNETMKVLGYTATKYIVEIATDRGQTLKENIWTTTEIKDLNMKSFTNHQVGGGRSMYYEGMEGVPVRMEMVTPQGSMVMEVASVQKESLPAADFTIPADFKEVPYRFGK